MITDRYKATGIPYPTQESCDECEGMGVIPEHKSTLNAEVVKAENGRLIIIGQKEKDGSPTEEDDYVFVLCPHCLGTRKQNATKEEKLEIIRKEFDL
jgi:hypothetical protein